MSGHAARKGSVAYRPDIDGLRAVAILPVVLYHAELGPFAGGFVGVDVFFVISGFLITSFIVAEIETREFTLANFYLRRVRRILPALLAVMAFCALVGWWLLVPDDYRLLGQSLFAATLSVSNVLFWWQSGYFDSPLEERPLLHTWSLGVEEQFYLVFPLYLVAVYRLPARWRVPLTACLAALSFAACVHVIRRDTSAAFFLAPYRMWELSIGALLAMGALRPPARAGAAEIAALAGAAMIVFATLSYSSKTLFPGYAALLPTIGTAALIWAGSVPGSTVTRLLSHRWSVFVGQVSYSYYLWHFPLLSFAAYVVTPGLGTGARIAIVLLSFGVAVLSWRFIEQPVRRGRGVFGNRRLVFGMAGAALSLFAGFGLLAHVRDGFPRRLDENAQRLLAGAADFNADRARCMTNEPGAVAEGSLCRLGDGSTAPTFALWGDSHAETLRPAVAQAAEAAGESGVFLGRGGCVPAVGVVRLDEPECGPVNEAILAYLEANPSIKKVLLAGRWGLWAQGTRYKRERRPPVQLATVKDGEPDNPAALSKGLETTVSRLVAAGKAVWLIGPTPEIGYPVPRALHIQRMALSPDFDIRPTKDDFLRRQSHVIDLFGRLSREYPVRAVWPHEHLCASARCVVLVDGESLYTDDNHLSRRGATFVATSLAPVFDSPPR